MLLVSEAPGELKEGRTDQLFRILAVVSFEI